jgi:magnesium transporter
VAGRAATEDAARRTPVAISPVGRRAAREFWSARSQETCSAALDRLRTSPPGAAPALQHCCYVVDAEERLVGQASLLAVLRAPPTSTIGEIMSPRVIPIPAGAPEEAVQDFFITYGLLAFPVVDRDGRLVGAVGVEHFSDLVFDRFDEQVREEAYRSVGLRAKEFERASAVAAAGLRLPWLLITLAGGFLAALVIAQARLELAPLAAIAAFLPLGIVLAERVTLRTLAIRAAGPGNDAAARALMRRELVVALLLGLVMGAVAGGLVVAWQGYSPTALLVAAAGFLVVLAGAVIGLLCPLGDQRAQSSRLLVPVALAVADVAAVAIYLTLARLLLAGAKP